MFCGNQKETRGESGISSKGKIHPPSAHPFDQTRDVISKARELELVQYIVTRVQASVLFVLLNQNREVTLAEISKWILRKPHSVSSLVSRMEKIGLVKKIKGREDDKIHITLTDKGSELYSKTNRR